MSGGKCLILSAPSGAGKTTLVHHLLQQNFGLSFSISACSRDPRPEETDGKDYYFLGVAGFKQKIAEEAFVEWEEVYPNQFYGTLKSEIERIWADGRHVIFDVDVVGGINLKKAFGEKALSIFVMPPTIDDLKARLESRNTETPEKIALRVAKSARELKFADQFDRVVLNDVLEQAKQEVEDLAIAFLNG